MARGMLPMDLHVAKRLRAARKAKGLSQDAVAKQLGLTFQQMGKYESGQNKVGAGKLARLAEIYGVQVQWFFENGPQSSTVAKLHQRDLAAELIAAPYGAKLAEAYLAIAHNKDRRVVVDVADALVQSALRQQQAAE